MFKIRWLWRICRGRFALGLRQWNEANRDAKPHSD